MYPSTLAKPKHERSTSNFGQRKTACVGPRGMIVPLPQVLQAYVTIHEQYRYPRILRVSGDTKEMQSKLDDLLRPGAAALLGAPDPAAAMERKKAAIQAALKHLRLGICLYAPLAPFCYSSYVYRRHTPFCAERSVAARNDEHSDLTWVGEQRSAA